MRYTAAKRDSPDRLVSGSDDFTMFMWEPATTKHPKARMTGHQQVTVFMNIACSFCDAHTSYVFTDLFGISKCSSSTTFTFHLMVDGWQVRHLINL